MAPSFKALLPDPYTPIMHIVSGLQAPEGKAPIRVVSKFSKVRDEFI